MAVKWLFGVVAVLLTGFLLCLAWGAAFTQNRAGKAGPKLQDWVAAYENTLQPRRGWVSGRSMYTARNLAGVWLDPETRIFESASKLRCPVQVIYNGQWHIFVPKSSERCVAAHPITFVPPEWYPLEGLHREGVE